jgi:hypothetical protein
MTPFTADELVIMVKARDLLGDKRLQVENSEVQYVDDNQEHYRLSAAHTALLDVLRHSYLDTRDEAPK